VVVVTTAVLIVAGDHVPVIPLVDVVGKAGAVLYWHREPIGLNIGMTRFLTGISITAFSAHCPTSGVNV